MDAVRLILTVLLVSLPLLAAVSVAVNLYLRLQANKKDRPK